MAAPTFNYEHWTLTGGAGTTNTFNSMSGDKCVVCISLSQSVGINSVLTARFGGVGGTNMTLIAAGNNSSPGEVWSAIYEYDNPPAGDNDIYVAWTPHGSLDHCEVTAYDISGCVTGVGAYDTDSDDDGSDLTCSCHDGNGIAISVVSSTTGGSVSSGCTETSTNCYSGYSTPSGSSENHVWTTGSYPCGAMAVFKGLPTISDCEDEDIESTETGVSLAGDQLNGDTVVLEIGDASTYGACVVKTTQTINSNDRTGIDFDVVLGSLSYGQNWLYVTTDGVTTAGYEINLYAPNAITSLDVSDFEPGQAVVITGALFGAAQSSSKVYLCDAADGSGTNTEQTVSAWGDTEITISIVKGSQSYGTNYLIVYRNNSTRGDSGDRKSNGQSSNLHANNVITSLDVSTFEDGDTVVITGASFGSSQGTSSVVLADRVDASHIAETQTVGAWGDTEITITAVQGALQAGVVYLIVKRNNAPLGDLVLKLSNGQTVHLTEEVAAVTETLPYGHIEIDPIAYNCLSWFERGHIRKKGMHPGGVYIRVRDNIREVKLP